MRKNLLSYEVIVIGAGHAGCEAALASARMGCQTLLLTINLDAIGLLPCSASIGGPGRGQLVREIDALGGEMAKAVDETYIHMREVNLNKGPGVRTLRALVDRRAYGLRMKQIVEGQENLELRQTMVDEIGVDERGRKHIYTRLKEEFVTESVVVATGTFLEGRNFFGPVSIAAGRHGEISSERLTESLRKLGISFARAKTATPPKVKAETVDLGVLEIQEPDPTPSLFSHDSTYDGREQLSCFITHTNENTHRIVLASLAHSSLLATEPLGKSSRYCPSIEEIVVRHGKEWQHRVFLQPEGRAAQEFHLQGVPTALPPPVQDQMVRSMKGLERCEITTPGYGVEYAYLSPLQLNVFLEHRSIKGLFFAGQVAGSNGYEEAAALGLMAGINATLRAKGREMLVLDRTQAYIGVLIDDLTCKEQKEPYRMLTSRCEYRLALRHDNADRRLAEIGHKLGLISAEQVERIREKYVRIEGEIERLKTTRICVYPAYKRFFPATSGDTMLANVLKSGQGSYADLKRAGMASQMCPEEERSVETNIKYEGYIEREVGQIEKVRKMYQSKIPSDIDYGQIRGLSGQGRDRLSEVRPPTLGHAAMIGGVTPQDLALLSVFLKKIEWEEKREKGRSISSPKYVQKRDES